MKTKDDQTMRTGVGVSEEYYEAFQKMAGLIRPGEEVRLQEDGHSEVVAKRTFYYIKRNEKGFTFEIALDTVRAKA